MNPGPQFFAILLTLNLLLPTAGLAQGVQAQDASSQSDKDKEKELQKWRAVLAKEGPEGRAERVQAVATLLGFDDARAHEILQERLVPDSDPHGVAREILNALAVRLAVTNDPVFALGRNRDQIRRSYVPRLVRYFVQPKDAGQEPALKPQARACLFAMQSQELGNAIRKLLEASEPTLQKAALYAVGESRHTLLAPLLAGHLQHPELGKAARSALYALTYRRFNELASFQTWYALNREKSYLALAEDAARSGVRKAEAAKAQLQQKWMGEVADHVGLLAHSSVPDKWQRIRDKVFQEEPPGIMRACLVQLQEELVELEVGKDCLVFYQMLHDELGRTPESPDYALLLEVSSYLARAGDQTVRENQQAILRLKLSAEEEPAIRLAALRGLRSYFNVENRHLVAALVAHAQGTGNYELLAAALDTLKHPDWFAPGPEDPDSQEWLARLNRALVDSSLDLSLREKVVVVMNTKDAQGQHRNDVFDRLLLLVADQTIELGLRAFTLEELNRLIADDVARQDNYVGRLMDLLADPLEDIRFKAAEKLAVLPTSDQKKQLRWGQSLVNRVKDRLQEEDSERVFKQLIVTLRDLVRMNPDAHVDAVIRCLNQTVQALRKTSNPDQQRLRDLMEGLSYVAKQKDLNPAQWLKACDTLVLLKDRADLMRVLNFHLAKTQPASLASNNPELEQWIWRVILQTAMLRDQANPWQASEATDQLEAAWVAAAFRAMDAREGPTAEGDIQDNQDTRILRLRCLAVSADAAAQLELIQLTEQWLDDADQTLQGSYRQEATLLAAQSRLREGQLDAASTTLRSLGIPDEQELQGRSTSLGIAIAEAYVEQSEESPNNKKGVLANKAAALCQWLLENAEEAAHPHCFLVQLEARALTADAQQRQDLLQKLEEKRLWYPKDGDKLLWQRFQDLRANLAAK